MKSHETLDLGQNKEKSPFEAVESLRSHGHFGHSNFLLPIEREHLLVQIRNNVASY